MKTLAKQQIIKFTKLKSIKKLILLLLISFLKNKLLY